MPPLSYSLEDIRDTPEIRAELAAFLVTSEGRPCPEALWLKRMQHWWGDNPAAGVHPARGWALRTEGRVVGFMACIPFLQAWQGKPVPTVAPAGWRVAVEHRGGSLPMLLKLRTMGREIPMVDTSPNAQVQVMLTNIGFRSARQRDGHVFVLGRWLGPCFSRLRAYPRLGGSLHVITDPGQVSAIARPFTSESLLENWVTPEFLRWRLAAPMQKLRFIGAVDAAGVLSSYLILAEHVLKGVAAWLMVDWFTTDPDGEEALALLGELSRDPGLAGEPRGLLEAAVFAAGNEAWAAAPSLLTLKREASYFYTLPPAFKDAVKRCVLADGDYGM